MTDIRIAWTEVGGVFAADFALEKADLATDDTLETAVLVSLFTDRRAPAEYELPAGETDRRGWWGDAYADPAGDEIGSLLWLLGWRKQIEETRLLAEQWATEALQWLIDDGVATAVEVVATFPRWLMLGLDIAVTEPSGRRRICQVTVPWSGVQNA
jgi:phage gp46-like protein